MTMAVYLLLHQRDGNVGGPHAKVDRNVNSKAGAMAHQRTSVLFSAPRSGCSQPPLTPDPGVSALFFP